MSYDLVYGRRSGDGERKLRNVSVSWTSASFSCINIKERGTRLRKKENNEWWGTEADSNGVCGPWNSSSLLLVWFLDSLQLTPCTQAHANIHKPSRPHYLPAEAFLIHTVCSLRPRFSFPFEIEADTKGWQSVGRRGGGQTHGRTASDCPAARRQKCATWTKIQKKKITVVVG